MCARVSSPSGEQDSTGRGKSGKSWSENEYERVRMQAARYARKGPTKSKRESCLGLPSGFMGNLISIASHRHLNGLCEKSQSEPYQLQ